MSDAVPGPAHHVPTSPRATLTWGQGRRHGEVGPLEHSLDCPSWIRTGGCSWPLSQLCATLPGWGAMVWQMEPRLPQALSTSWGRFASVALQGGPLASHFLCSFPTTHCWEPRKPDPEPGRTRTGESQARTRPKNTASSVLQKRHRRPWNLPRLSCRNTTEGPGTCLVCPAETLQKALEPASSVLQKRRRRPWNLPRLTCKKAAEGPGTCLVCPAETPQKVLEPASSVLQKHHRRPWNLPRLSCRNTAEGPGTCLICPAETPQKALEPASSVLQKRRRRPWNLPRLSCRNTVEGPGTCLVCPAETPQKALEPASSVLQKRRRRPWNLPRLSCRNATEGPGTCKGTGGKYISGSGAPAHLGGSLLSHLCCRRARHILESRSEGAAAAKA
eukprot:XP_011521824.1 uncharacterized protein LOC105371419 [Homo sapiens]